VPEIESVDDDVSTEQSSVLKPGFFSQLDVSSVSLSNIKSDLMIISTQSSINKTNKKLSRGCTGRAIQSNVGGGYMVMRQDNQLTTVDKEQLQQHIRPGGLLVLTGHGNSGITVLKGRFHTHDVDNPQLPKQNINIEYTVKDFVDTVMSAGTLHPGDCLNVLIYACSAGSGSNENSSFANHLANEFVRHGISTVIYASIASVGRIGSLKADEIPQQLIKFRAKSGDIRLLKTMASATGKVLLRNMRSYPHEFFISRLGFGSRQTIEECMYDFIQRKKLHHGDHYRYAAALAYFLSAHEMIVSERVPVARQKFLELPLKDRECVESYLHAINKDVYRQLELEEARVGGIR
jgi:hypothetical protein